MLDLLLLGFIVLSLEFGGAMHGWRVLCLSGISLEFKIDGQGIPHRYGFTVLAARFKLGQSFDHTDCLSIKFLTNRANYLDFSHLTGLVNNKLNNDTAFNIVLCGLRGIFDVSLQVSHQSGFSTWESGHLLDRVIDLIIGLWFSILGSLLLGIHFDSLGNGVSLDRLGSGLGLDGLR